MCRLYGQITPAPRDAGEFLARSERSLLRQANFRRKDYQKDGWGIAHFDGNRARVVKSPEPVFEEAARFGRLAASIRSRVIIGHLRAASNPLRLSRKELLGPDNTQPFTDGRFVFAHNGTVQIPLEVAQFLGPYRDSVRGLNDSEIYFWQFRKFYDLYGDVPSALQACVSELWALWNHRPRRGKKKVPYIGLNTLVSDGHSLHAMCHYPHKHPKLSLFNPRQAWGRMSYARRGDRVIFSSEDLDTGGWDHFKNPEIISATISGGKVSVSRRAFRPGDAP
ncbi:MAG: class II glutamine amidotransferase [Elusimicrobia bacterium]|nr:class II glutamine amidotransferase [Elusimicrobiota bacterium]